MKLSDLPNWPVKKELNGFWPDGEVRMPEGASNIGYNQALQDCDLSLECDVEAMAKELYEICTYPDPTPWEDETVIQDAWRTRASIICEQLPKFLKLSKKICPADEKGK